MKQTMDLVIRGGWVVDGLGGEPFEADVGVSGDRIVQIGAVEAAGTVEIDARGQVVTPGFVDIHTHYDGQAVWSSRFVPSSLHGVTTVVMGNCGVGFAPVRQADQERLVELMEGVEDIPGVALTEGLDWQWESFPDFLAALERRPHDLDFCAYLPHAPLRVYVMSERATRLEAATADDIARMRALATEAVRAGAIGFSTSRSINHRSASGNPMPSLKAAEEELTAIALGLKDAGRGVLQMILDFDDPELLGAEFAMLRRIVQASGRPLSFSMMQKHGNKAGFQRLLDLTAAAAAEGLPIRAQVAPRIVGVLLGLQGSRNVFSECPGYAEIADLPLAQRVARMRDPQLQDRLVREVYLSRTPLGRRLTDFENMFPLGDPPDYDPGPERSIAAEARRRGLDPAQVALDYLLRDEGRFTLVSPFANYADRNLDACARMLAHGQTVIGLGDGGAHVSLVSDASFPTTLLTQWLGHDGGNPAFGLPALVKKQTHDTAMAVGLNDRGVLRAGMKADINVIDMDALRLEPPVIQHDLPAGSARYVQRARGYRATVVSGQVVYRDGEPAGPLPGRLVRG